jgi:hypothetical protein
VAGLLVLFFCPTDDWKMATIAEFLFIRLFRGSGYLHLRISGKMCRFLRFTNANRDLDFIGVLWNPDAIVWRRFDGRCVPSFWSSAVVAMLRF